MPDKIKPKYIVVARTDMPSIAYKIMLYKAFGEYPSDENIEFCVRPDLVSDDKAYVIDRGRIEAECEASLANLDQDFGRGYLDDMFKVGSASWLLRYCRA